MFNQIYSLDIMLLSTLGRQDGLHQLFSFLYGAAAYVIVLAMINSILAMPLNAAIKSNSRFRNCIYYFKASLAAQAIFGLAPIALCTRAAFMGEEVSIYVYGMPALQLLIIVFLLFLQFRLLRVINSPLTNRSTGAGNVWFPFQLTLVRRPRYLDVRRNRGCLLSKR